MFADHENGGVLTYEAVQRAAWRSADQNWWRGVFD